MGFLVAAPGGQQHNKHTDRLTAIDRPDNQHAYLLNTLGLLQAASTSVQLRQARPHSCIRNRTPPIWSAAASSSSIAAARQVCPRPRCSLFSNTPPASCKQASQQAHLLRNLPPASNAARDSWAARQPQAMPQRPRQHQFSRCVLPDNIILPTAY